MARIRILIALYPKHRKASPVNSSNWTPTLTTPVISQDPLALADCVSKVNGVFGSGSNSPALLVLAGVAYGVNLPTSAGSLPTIGTWSNPTAKFREVDSGAAAVPSPAPAPSAPDTLTLTNCVSKVDGVFGTGNDNPVLVVLGGTGYYRDPVTTALTQNIPQALTAPGVLFHELQGSMDVSFNA